MENTVDDGRNRHGYPRGYHFVPHDLELVRLLDEQRAGRRLPYPLPNIFHHVRIRDFHPAHLYEKYREHEEAGYIYFFDHREYRTAGRGPARATVHGVWKSSGGGKAVRRGGVVVGYKLTMVFYQKEEHPRKTDWALNEYTTIVGPNKKVADLALYRLYNKKTGRGAVPAPVEVKAPPPPCPTAGGTYTANQASVADSTSPQAAEGYRADEFKVWCETKQEDRQAASPCWFPTPYHDLPMLMDESELYSCTLEELLAPMQDRAAAPATSMPDANQDYTAAPATTSTPDANHQV